MLERGVSSPSLNTIVRIGAGLGVKEEELIRLTLIELQDLKKLSNR